MLVFLELHQGQTSQTSFKYDYICMYFIKWKVKDSEKEEALDGEATNLEKQDVAVPAGLVDSPEGVDRTVGGALLISG